jgi:hypothetical protein
MKNGQGETERNMLEGKTQNLKKKKLQSKERENDNAINDGEVFPKRLTRIELFEKRKGRGMR